MKKIKCSNGLTCFISHIEVNNQPVLVLDMRIKNYTAMNQDRYWQVFPLPPNAIIQDKVYLDEEIKNKIITILDDFIETTFLNNDEATCTQRGFSHLALKDMYGNNISIQESSSVTPSLWFGVDTNNNVFKWEQDKIVQMTELKDRDVLINDRLHLRISHAKKLKNMIEKQWQLAIDEKEP